jgi:hypothetical protein
VSNTTAGITSTEFSGTQEDCEFFSHAVAAIIVSANAGMVAARNKYYANATGIRLAVGLSGWVESDSSFGVGTNGGTQANTTADIAVTASHFANDVWDNCTFASSTLLSGASFLQARSKLSISREGGTATDNTTYVAAGTLTEQSSVVRDSTYAPLMTFTSSAVPFDVDFQVVGSSGSPLVVSGYLRKNSTYGSGVALPTVQLSGLGMTTSTATMADVNDSWEQFTVSGTPTRSGLADLRIRGQAASGSLYMDTFIVAGVAVNTGDFDLWHLGYPIETILSTGLGALDIWTVPKSTAFGSGTMGEQVAKKISTKVVPEY